MKDTQNDINDRVIEDLAIIDDASNRLIQIAKESSVNLETVIYVDEDGNDQYLIVYDHKTQAWLSTDTFDKIAEKEYGDASYGTILAYYNGVKKENELAAGTLIKIPIFVQNDKVLLNKVYYPPEQKELYGRDIQLSDDGNFTTFAGDFKIVAQKENLAQGIVNRLATSVAKRIRLTSYGIKTSVGTPRFINNYILASMEQTVLADPRVATVDEINFSGVGDNLQAEVVYTDHNHTTGRAEGVF